MKIINEDSNIANTIKEFFQNKKLERMLFTGAELESINVDFGSVKVDLKDTSFMVQSKGNGFARY